MKTRLVGVVELEMADGRTAVALMFDNMRWMLDYSEDPADYEELKKEIGCIVNFDDDEAHGPLH